MAKVIKLCEICTSRLTFMLKNTGKVIHVFQFVVTSELK